MLDELGSQARLLSGGQSLGPMLNLRLARPGHVIDLNDLTEFSYVRELANCVEIGGLTRHYQLAESTTLRAVCPLLPLAAQTIGHYAIRQRGTLGGSLANADPVAQLALVAMALDAKITLVRRSGRRELKASEFFRGAMATGLQPQEMLLSVRFPKFKDGEVCAYRMFNRRHGDFAVVSVATTLALHEGRVQRLRLALSGVASMPVSLNSLARQFEGRHANAQWAHEVADAMVQGLQPEEDERIPVGYRLDLAKSLSLRALLRTLEKLEAANA